MADPAIDLCPACGYRVADTEEGFCATCSGRRQLGLYEAKDRQAAEERNERWREWSNMPEAMVARQRRHRLLSETKPERSPTQIPTPWCSARKPWTNSTGSAKPSEQMCRDGLTWRRPPS